MIDQAAFQQVSPPELHCTLHLPFSNSIFHHFLLVAAQQYLFTVQSSNMALSVSKPGLTSLSVAEQSWQSLIDDVLAFIDSHPRPYPYNRMEKPYVPNDYTTRDSPLEVCAVEICHAHPEFMVVGTYALVSQEDQLEHGGQMRKGTLSIMTVAAKFQATYAGMQPPTLDKHEFSSAILDLHFHPNDDSLLCVATSAASVHFYRLFKHASVLDRRIEMKLLPLGWAKIAEDDEHGLIHLITQFSWLPEIDISGKEGINDQLLVTLAATESSGRVQLVKVPIPAIRDTFDRRAKLQSQPQKLPFSRVYLQTHSEEAWTVSTFDIPSPPGMKNRFLLSGGDDCALKTSLLNLTPSHSNPDLPPDLEILASQAIDGWTDSKSYNGGVISILPLSPTLITCQNPSFTDESETTIPVLTGSYDDTIRLYLINPSTMLRRLVLDMRLGGGVWRLKLMDDYDIATKHHFIILVSCMHAGVRILRVCYDSALTEGWTIEVIARFEKGHESMVYCCDFLKEEDPGAYTVVSTSFYDKKICTWRFVDSVKKKLNEELKMLRENGSWELLGTQGTSVSSASTTGWVKEDGEWKVR